MTFEEWWSGVIDEKDVGSVPEAQHKGIAKLAWEAAKERCAQEADAVAKVAEGWAENELSKDTPPETWVAAASRHIATRIRELK